MGVMNQWSIERCNARYEDAAETFGMGYERQAELVAEANPPRPVLAKTERAFTLDQWKGIAHFWGNFDLLGTIDTAAANPGNFSGELLVIKVPDLDDRCGVDACAEDLDYPDGR